MLLDIAATLEYYDTVILTARTGGILAGVQGIMKATTSRQRHLKGILSKRMESLGYRSQREFWMNAIRTEGLELTQETVRRAMNPGEDFRLEPWTYAQIMRSLRYTPPEIAALLKDYTDDHQLWPMLSQEQPEYSADEVALVNAFRALKKGEGPVMTLLAMALEQVGTASGVNMADHAMRIRHSGKVL